MLAHPTKHNVDSVNMKDREDRVDRVDRGDRGDGKKQETRQKKTTTVGILNANGIQGYYEEILEDMERREIDMMFISETWMSARSRPIGECMVVNAPYKRDEERSGGQRNHYGVGLLLNPRRIEEKEQVQVIGVAPGLGIKWRWKGTTYIGVYLPPSWNDKECLDLINKLDEMPSKAKRTKADVVCGDFNLRARWLGDRINNARANGEVMEWLETNGYRRQAPTPDIATFVRCIRLQGDESANQRSIVDHFFIEGGFGDKVKDCKVIESSEITISDHRTVILTSTAGEADTATARKPAKYKRWNLRRLKEDAEVAKGYGESITKSMQTILAQTHERRERLSKKEADAQETVDWLNDSITQAIFNDAKSQIGQAAVKGHKGRLDDREIRQLAEKRRALTRAAKEKPELELWGLVEEARRKERNAIKCARQKAFDRFSKEVEELSHTERAKILRRVKTSQQRSCTALLAKDEESMEKYRAHFEAAFETKDFHREATGHTDSAGTPETGVPEPLGIIDLTVTRAIEGSGNGKAPGKSGMIIELIKPVKELVSPALRELFEICWETGTIPRQWKEARICPVPKKGDLTEIANYRPITLTEILRKVYERVLLEQKLRRSIEPLDVAQGGFRARRGTIDQVAALHEAIVHRTRTLGHAPAMAFLDIKAAYDTVDRGLLWRKLRERGASTRLIGTCKALYDDCRSTVVVGEQESKALLHEKGLLQGSITSPILYALFLDDLAARVRIRSRGTLGNTSIASFLYADDIAIVGDNLAHLQEMLNEAERHSMENGYRFAPGKCEIIARAEEREKGAQTKLYGRELPFTDTFVYLGVVVGPRGVDWEKQTHRLCRKGGETVQFFRPLGLNAKGLGNKAKQMLLLHFIRPTLEYGIALFPERKRKLVDKLSRIMLFAIRSMLGAPKNAPKEILYDLAGAGPMETRRVELQAKWMQRTRTLPGEFMVSNAWKAYERRRHAESIMRAEEKNPIIQRYRRELWKTGFNCTNEQRKEAWDVALTAYRRERREAMLAGSSLAAVRKTESETGWLHKLDQTSDRADHNELIRWIIRRPERGRPEKCHNCKTRSRTVTHMQTCTGIDADRLIRDDDFTSATQAIHQILKRCKPQG